MPLSWLQALTLGNMLKPITCFPSQMGQTLTDGAQL